jgi:hypothetical protein
MANTKISELPLFTGNTSGSYLVMNNSGQTTTYKIQKENYVFPYNGAAVISGSLAVSGSITTTANSTFNTVVVGRGGNTGSFGSTRVGANSLSYSGVGAVGGNNTAIGVSNLTFNSVGSNNTAVGAGNLSNNISGSFNTAIGQGNLANLTTGNENTSIGWSNLNAMVTGSSQIAIGTSNLTRYKGGDFNNMAIGPRFTLNLLESGAENIAIGSYAMQNVRTGSNNTVIGGGALANCTGSNNIALGFYAGTNLTGTVNNTLVIDSLYRTFYPNEGLIYGTMNSTVANQTLKFNAATTITNNLTITGSLTVSGSAATDVNVIGNLTARNGNNTKVINLNTDNGLIQLDSSSFAQSILGIGKLELSKNADKIEITAEGTTGSKCQFRTTEPTGSQVTIIELPCVSDWNGGTTRFKYPVEITGSLKVTDVLNVQPLYYGTGSVYSGSINAVSGSYGDIRMMYDDGGYRQLYVWGGNPPGDWLGLF